ncbi:MULTISPECIES: HEPN domain-containing protein [Bacillus cereus group]|uniref:HEPN domain-containing protein n=1 Tax=Bacillus cereus group TaxID=86661 RepID=UPI0022E2ACE5|nr:MULTISPECIES: HEPN domain-containing protein [Bacillus cereus group]MDA2768661.1 HEPN domain-containing protein [Bacillus cereus group sp. Bc010]MED1445107.1 HEPN domain-containing protein [Bacillus pacificus]
MEKKQILSEFEEFESRREHIEKLSQSILLYNGTLDHIYFSPVITFSYFADNGMIRMIEYINEVHNKSRSKHVVIKDTQLFTDYFNKIIQLPKKSIALERLTSAHNKVNLEDKFIDLAIALESMYPSVKGEVSFKISLYTAKLLDGSQDTFKKVKNLYGIRSNLVHGNSDLSREKLQKKLEELDGIVRQTIVKSLEYSIQDLKLDKMEENILKTLLPN